MKMADKKKVTKKAAKKSPKERVLGIALVGTTKGNILKELLDGKTHKIEDLKECRVNADDSVGWRLSMLKTQGKHADKPFKLELDDTEVKLVPLKASTNSHSNGSTNGHAKSKAPAKSKAKEVPGAIVSKASVQDVPADEEE
jgi:hypothetical protein